MNFVFVSQAVAAAVVCTEDLHLDTFHSYFSERTRKTHNPKSRFLRDRPLDCSRLHDLLTFVSDHLVAWHLAWAHHPLDLLLLWCLPRGPCIISQFIVISRWLQVVVNTFTDLAARGPWRYHDLWSGGVWSMSYAFVLCDQALQWGGWVPYSTAIVCSLCLNLPFPAFGAALWHALQPSAPVPCRCSKVCWLVWQLALGVLMRTIWLSMYSMGSL